MDERIILTAGGSQIPAPRFRKGETVRISLGMEAKSSARSAKWEADGIYTVARVRRVGRTAVTLTLVSEKA